MNKLKLDSEYLGLDYKKEIIKIVVIDTLIISAAIVSYVVLKNALTSIVVGALAIIATYLLLLNISNKRVALEAQRDQEFISNITIFQSFISNNCNVYTAFNKSLSYASFWMKEQLVALLEGIDKDKTVKPYLDFSKKFSKNYVETVMLSIFQMVDEGENNAHFEHFNNLFDSIAMINKTEKISQKQKALETTTIFPLIGAGLITVLLTFGIISIIGDLINVI